MLDLTRGSNVTVFWLEQGGQNAKDGHKDDWECLPGDGDPWPGLHCDGRGGQSLDEHVDQLIVVEGNVPLHVSSVEGADGGHRLLIHPGADEGEDEAPDPEYEHAAGEPHQADGAEGGEELNAEIKEGWKEEEILQREEEEWEV